MGHKTGARILLVVGFLAAFIGYDAWIATHALFDPGATRAAAHALLEAPAVRKGLADQISESLDQQIPNAKRDPRAHAAVAAALRDPRVANAFADTVAQIHAAVMSSSSPEKRQQTFTIDGRALTAALHDALAPKDPKLAAQLLKVPPLKVQIKANDMPRLHDPRSTANVVTVLAIMAALLFITASLLMQHDRGTIGRVGRRTAYLALTPLIVFFALPRVLENASGDAPQIASALLRVYGDRVLPSAIALIVVGLVIVVGAIVWPRHPFRDAHDAANGIVPYTGPESPRPRVAPEQPAISEKMYL
jgi:hypothetical protein